LVIFKAAGGFIYYFNRFVRVLKVTATAGVAEKNYASQHFGQPFVGGLVDVLVWVFFHGYILSFTCSQSSVPRVSMCHSSQ
jgi:hypothetical protein